MPCKEAEEVELVVPGICPSSLFLSNRNSTRFPRLPSSGGILPVNPLERRSLKVRERNTIKPTKHKLNNKHRLSKNERVTDSYNFMKPTKPK